jgi:predicted dehydrogenase
MNTNLDLTTAGSLDLTRRQFLVRAGAASLGATLLQPQLAHSQTAGPKLDLGLIGCGGRGRWIADLFAASGRFNVVAGADYFSGQTAELAKKHNLPAERCFSGLSGYRKLLDLKLDAVVIESPPYFHPEQAAAAVAAGKHVYLAKPAAVDVPGALLIAESAKLAAQKKQVFLVDFQTRAHPAYQEAVRRVHQGDLGRLVSIYAEYQTNLIFQGWDDELRKSSSDPEVRLRTWGVDRVLSGDVIVEQNIHALDVASWFANAEPLKAYGAAGRARPFVGDCRDHFAVLFFYPNDLVVTFSSKQVGYGYDDIMVRAHGLTGTAETHYSGKVWLRSREDIFNSDSNSLYAKGTELNIAAFHDAITKGDYSNPTVAPSVRSNLTGILGRLAADRQGEVTWKEMLQTAERWTFDTSGLKA